MAYNSIFSTDQPKKPNPYSKNNTGGYTSVFEAKKIPEPKPLNTQKQAEVKLKQGITLGGLADTMYSGYKKAKEFVSAPLKAHIKGLSEVIKADTPAERFKRIADIGTNPRLAVPKLVWDEFSQSDTGEDLENYLKSSVAKLPGQIGSGLKQRAALFDSYPEIIPTLMKLNSPIPLLTDKRKKVVIGENGWKVVEKPSIIGVLQNKIMTPFLNESGDKLKEYSQKKLEEHPEWKVETDLKMDGSLDSMMWNLKNHPIQYFTKGIGENLPLFGLQIGTALIGGGWSSMALMDLVTSGETYEEALDFGAPKNKAAVLGGIRGIVESSLEKAGLDNLFKLAGGKEIKNTMISRMANSLAGRIAEGFVTEGITEFLQEVSANVIAMSYDENRKWWQGAFDAGLIGGLFGSSFAGIGAGYSGQYARLRPGASETTEEGVDTDIPPVQPNQDQSDVFVPSELDTSASIPTPIRRGGEFIRDNAGTRVFQGEKIITEDGQVIENPREGVANIRVLDLRTVSNLDSELSQQTLVDVRLGQDLNEAFNNISDSFDALIGLQGEVVGNYDKIKLFNDVKKLADLKRKEIPPQEIRDVLNRAKSPNKIRAHKDEVIKALESQGVRIPTEVPASQLATEGIATPEEIKNVLKQISLGAFVPPFPVRFFGRNFTVPNERASELLALQTMNRPAQVEVDPIDVLSDFLKNFGYDEGLADYYRNREDVEALREKGASKRVADIEKLPSRQRASIKAPKSISRNDAERIVRKYFSEDEVGAQFVNKIQTPAGQIALGRYFEGIIQMVENPDITTPHHEAFHAYMDMFVPAQQKMEALEDIKKIYDVETNMEAEEILAQDFAEFAVGRDNANWTQKLKQLFGFLLDKFRMLVGKKPKINQLFRDLQARSKVKVKSGAELRKQNKGSVTTPGLDGVREEYYQEPEALTIKLLKESKFANAETAGRQELLDYSKSGKANLKANEKELIAMVLESEQFKDQKKVNMKEFKDAVVSELLPLDVIDSDTYSDYGAGNLEMDMDYAKAKTHIYDSPFKHGNAGHFSRDYDYWERPEVDETPVKVGEMWGVFKKGSDTTDVINAVLMLNSETLAADSIRFDSEKNTYYVDVKLRKEPGLFGHTRVWDSEEGTTRYIAEIQSDTFQKTRDLDKSISLKEEINHLETRREGIDALVSEINKVKGDSIERDTFNPESVDYLYRLRTISSAIPKGQEFNDAVRLMIADGEIKKEMLLRGIEQLKKGFDEKIAETTKLAEEARAEFEKAGGKTFMQYKNNWHERLIKEEIRRASLEGKTTLLVPDLYTIAKIEGYISGGTGETATPYEYDSDYSTLSAGDSVTYLGEEYQVVEADDINIQIAKEADVINFSISEFVSEDAWNLWSEVDNQVKEIEEKMGVKIDNIKTVEELLDLNRTNQKIRQWEYTKDSDSPSEKPTQAEIDSIPEGFPKYGLDWGTENLFDMIVASGKEEFTIDDFSDEWVNTEYEVRYSDFDPGELGYTAYTVNGDNVIATIETVETLMQPDQYEEVTDAEGFDYKEQFSEGDASYAILRFYDKKIIPYVQKTRKAEKITDPNGNPWWQFDITDADRGAVEAFQLAPEERQPDFTGEEIAQEAVGLGSDQGGISEYTANQIANEDYKTQSISIDELRQLDPDLDEYLKSGEIRDFEGESFAMSPIVSSKGEVLDGYNRIAQSLANGDTEIDILRGINKSQQPKFQTSPEEGQVIDINGIKEKYPDVELVVNEDSNFITLSVIKVPKELQNQGIGSSVMRDLTTYADSIGKAIATTPTSDFGASIGRLKEWNKRFGFVENKGKNKDFQTRESFIRQPQQPKFQTSDKLPSFTKKVEELSAQKGQKTEEIEMTKEPIVFPDEDMEAGYKDFKALAKRRPWMLDTGTDSETLKARITNTNIDNMLYSGQGLNNDEVLEQFKDRFDAEEGKVEKGKQLRTEQKEIQKDLTKARKEKAMARKVYREVRKEISEEITQKFKDRASQVDDIKKTITNYAKMLPLEERGKLLEVVRKAKTKGDLAKALVRIDTRFEESEKKRLVGEIKKKYKKALNSPSVDVKYKEKMRDLLDDFEFTTTGIMKLKRLKATKEYLAEQKANGEDVFLPLKVLQELETLDKMPIKKLPSGMLDLINEELARLDEMGRTKTKMRERLWEAKKEAILEAVVPELRPFDRPDVIEPGIGEELSKKEKVVNMAIKMKREKMRVGKAIKPIDVFFDMYSGGNAMYETEFFRRFKGKVDLQFSSYLTIKDEIQVPIIKLAEDLNLNDLNMERIGIYAQVQQPGGMDKLLQIGVDEDQALAIKLDTKEQRFYDAMIEVFDKNFPLIQEYMAKVYNKEVKKVDNYFPMVTDFEAMNDLEIYQRFGDNIGLDGQPIEGSPQPKKNIIAKSTFSRMVNAKQKIKLNAMHVFLEHTDNFTYMLQMGETMKMLKEVTNNPDFSEAIGQDGKEFLLKWIDLVVRKGGDAGASQIKILDMLRRNVSAAVLGFKLSSVLIQPSAFFDGAAEIGMMNASKGARQMALSPEWRKFVMENMPELRNRIADDPAFKELSKVDLIKRVQEASFSPLQKLDAWTATSIAIGGYMKKMDDLGLEYDLRKPNQEALDYAQLAVRRTQASGMFKDLPLAISRGEFTGNKSLDKIIFQFQSFLLNRWSYINYDLPQELRNNPKKGVEAMTWMIMSSVYAAGSGVLSKEILAMLFGGDGEDDDATKMVLEEIAQTIPGISHLWSLAGYGSIPIPILGIANRAGSGFYGLANYKSTKSKTKAGIRAVFGLSGLAGLPGSLQIQDIILRLLDD